MRGRDRKLQGNRSGRISTSACWFRHRAACRDGVSVLLGTYRLSARGVLCFGALSDRALDGPPFQTDGSTPVDLGHYQLHVFSGGHGPEELIDGLRTANESATGWGCRRVLID
jgi:hypothetical protein